MTNGKQTIAMHKLIPELLFKVFSDPYPPCQAAYLYAMTEGNQDSVIDKGIALLETDTIQQLWIADSGPKSGYIGIDKWLDILDKRGVPEDKIKGIDIHHFDMINTYIEAFEIIRYAKKNNIARLLIVSAPFHQLRAFSTVVTAALRQYPELKVYSQPGHALSWQENVSHSQGTLYGNREEFIYSELERMEKYNKKGDLASIEEILDYLSQRDL